MTGFDSPTTSLSRENAVRSLKVCERMLQDVRDITISGTRLVSVYSTLYVTWKLIQNLV